MDEMFEKIKEHSVYVEAYKTEMVPMHAIKMIVQDVYNKQVAETLSKVEDELTKLSKSLNTLNLND